jgi:hypothetical protein
MLLAMIVASAMFGYWVHWSREWIRQRQEAIEADNIHYFSAVFTGHFPELGTPATARAPYGLWIFGEQGIVLIGEIDATQVERTKNLFPEARIKATGQPPIAPSSWWCISLHMTLAR